MSANKKIQAVIFDFNGVLWWDSDLQEAVWMNVSREIRGFPLTREEMAVHMHGRNNRYLLEYLSGKKLSAEEVVKLTEFKESAYRKECLAQGQNFCLSPGAIPLLDFLTAAKISITIATASGLTNLQFFFEHLNLGKWFQFEKIVYDDGTIPGKPAPDLFLKAASNLKAAPENSLVVEDAESGLKAANNAKIGTIVALGPDSVTSNFQKHTNISFTIKDLSELQAYLQKSLAGV